jgi:hypothetical protein
MFVSNSNMLSRQEIIEAVRSRKKFLRTFPNSSSIVQNGQRFILYLEDAFIDVQYNLLIEEITEFLTYTDQEFETQLECTSNETISSTYLGDCTEIPFKLLSLASERKELIDQYWKAVLPGSHGLCISGNLDEFIYHSTQFGWECLTLRVNLVPGQIVPFPPPLGYIEEILPWNEKRVKKEINSAINRMPESQSQPIPVEILNELQRIETQVQRMMNELLSRETGWIYASSDPAMEPLFIYIGNSFYVLLFENKRIVRFYETSREHILEELFNRVIVAPHEMKRIPLEGALGGEIMDKILPEAIVHAVIQHRARIGGGQNMEKGWFICAPKTDRNEPPEIILKISEEKLVLNITEEKLWRIVHDKQYKWVEFLK